MTPKLTALKTALQSEGLEAGLRVLNEPIGHRYTALYRLEGAVLHNVALFDKQGEMRPEFLAEVPLEDSFCQFVMRDGVFRTENTGQDDRLDGHKYQGVLLSYHGVPVLDDRGDLYGTLCHFDAMQRSLPDEDFQFMHQAARLIPGFLPR